MILLCIFVNTRVSADDDGAMNASTIPTSAVIETDSQESTFGRSAAELNTTTTDSFDYGYFVVLVLGFAGLYWTRRQSRHL